MNDKKSLILRVITPTGIVYENNVFSVKIRRRDGLMVIYKNYAPVLERLADGKITITEDKNRNNKVSFNLKKGWLTVTDNKCNIYSLVAQAV